MITYSHGHSQTPEEKRSESILNNTVGTMDPYFDSFLTTPLSKFFFKMQLFYFQRLFHNQQVCPSQSWILQNHHYFRSQIDCDNGSIFLKYLRTATFGLPMSVKIWTYAAVLRRDKSSMGRNNKTEQNKKRKTVFSIHIWSIFCLTNKRKNKFFYTHIQENISTDDSGVHFYGKLLLLFSRKKKNRRKKKDYTQMIQFFVQARTTFVKNFSPSHTGNSIQFVRWRSESSAHT